MHEMALAEGILAVVLDAARRRKVRAVRVRIGALNAVVPESLQLAFRLAAEESCADRAVLEIEEVPATFQCRRCGAEGAHEGLLVCCRSCGGSDIKVLSGAEVLVEVIELESGGEVSRETAASDLIRARLREPANADHEDHERG